MVFGHVVFFWKNRPLKAPPCESPTCPEPPRRAQCHAPFMVPQDYTRRPMIATNYHKKGRQDVLTSEDGMSETASIVTDTATDTAEGVAYPEIVIPKSVGEVMGIVQEMVNAERARTSPLRDRTSPLRERKVRPRSSSGGTRESEGENCLAFSFVAPAKPRL